jgi:hypothetical protein
MVGRNFTWLFWLKVKESSNSNVTNTEVFKWYLLQLLFLILKILRSDVVTHVQTADVSSVRKEMAYWVQYTMLRPGERDVFSQAVLQNN